MIGYAGRPGRTGAKRVRAWVSSPDETSLVAALRCDLAIGALADGSNDGKSGLVRVIACARRRSAAFSVSMVLGADVVLGQSLGVVLCWQGRRCLIGPHHRP